MTKEPQDESMTKEWDVIIAGGGLAGLGLAHQLMAVAPHLKIIILEKNTFPRPHAIAKVGESTVEIGSHYLAKHLGLQQHLQDKHLKKFGIRMFFGDSDDFSLLDELGASQTFGIPTYQIDRGVIENHLADRVRKAGVTIVDGASINAIEIHASHKKVTFSTEANAPQTLSSAWFVDAAGRASLLKSHLDLRKKNAHRANAVWFRVDKKIIIDDWSPDSTWRQRCTPEDRRWLSTNHLAGPGYWVWIIPLASGVTSIGIVMDDTSFQSSKIRCENSARAWLAEHQKRCANAIAEANFLDFVVLQDYSYDCKQMFSADGWAITGEAGVFADPFYSPGSDFIAISNIFITELIRSQTSGEDIRLKTLVFEKLFSSIYQNTLSLYTGQYGGFGDRVMMGLKLLWDYSYYWGVLSLLYFRNALADVDLIRKLSPQLQQAQTLNQDMQRLFRKRAERRLQLTSGGTFMNQYKIPCLQHFNRVLMNESEGDVSKELSENMHMLAIVADAVRDMLSDQPSTEISDVEQAILGEYRNTLRAAC